MKKSTTAKTNLEIFFEILDSFEVDRSDQPTPTIKDVRREMYVNKLVGMLWFEEALPDDPEEPFRYFFNDDFEFYDVFDELDALSNLNLQELRSRSGKIQRPEWVGPDTLSKENTLSKLLAKAS